MSNIANRFALNAVERKQNRTPAAFFLTTTSICGNKLLIIAKYGGCCVVPILVNERTRC